ERGTNLAWTGVEMVVWGGSYDTTGGLYNPTTNSWRAMNTANAPIPRNDHTAIWTGQEYIVWGGGPIETATGGRYDIQYTPNTAPEALPDSYTTPQDIPLIVDAPGVLDNDSDPDDDPLTADLVTTPVHGTLALQADGGFSYTPDAGYSGEDSFTYRAYDGLAYSEPTTVQLTVTPVTATYELFLPVILQP
ncbi:MAG: cadherin-like domain-containing protein, partial [Anaerolineales bacterium]|nr:cadherin-like domain-containing protein [Anaerolineales bacterium]